MNYPQRPQTQNGYQALGQLLGQGGQLVNQFSDAQTAEEDRQLRLQALRQDMIEKRTAAAMAKIKAEREAADEANKQSFLDAVKTGMPVPDATETVPGQPRPIGSPSSDVLTQPPQSIGAQAAPQLGYKPMNIQSILDQAQVRSVPQPNRRPTAAEVQDMALRYNQLTPKDYLEPSPYEKAKATMEGSIAGGALDKIKATQRDRFSVANQGGRRIQTNLDTGEQTDLGSAENPITPYQAAQLNRLNNMPIGGAMNTRSLMTDSRAARMDYEKAAKPYLALKGIVNSKSYGTGLGDQSMIDKLIIIETGKVPTEAQYFQVAKNLGISDKIDKVTGRLLTGEIMGPVARKNLMDQAEEQMRITHGSYQDDLNQFQETARLNNVNVNAVSRRGGYYENVDKYLGGSGENPLTTEPPAPTRQPVSPKHADFRRKYNY